MAADFQICAEVRKRKKLAAQKLKRWGLLFADRNRGRGWLLIGWDVMW
jgi:hypothetical protein